MGKAKRAHAQQMDSRVGTARMRLSPSYFRSRKRPMNKTLAKLGRRLRLGVIGGGPGSFIGTVHRTAARLDDNYEVVAAVLSSDPERSRAAGRAIGLARRSRLWQRRRDVRRRGLALRRHGGRRHHDAERQPLPLCGQGDRARPRRDLRQAARPPISTTRSISSAASAPPASSSARPSTTPASRWSGRRAPWSATATSARSAWSMSSTSRATTPR